MYNKCIKKINNGGFMNNSSRSNIKKVNNVKNNDRRNINQKNYSNKKKGKKKKFILIFTFLLIAFLICCIYLLFTLDIFNISKINVSGITKYTQDEIITSSKLNIGSNMFRQIFTSKFKENIKTLPFVDEVKFSITLPSIFNIEIKERTSKYFAFDKEHNTYYRIDKDGIILEKTSLENKTENELLVYGLAFDKDVKLGSKLNDIYMSKIQIYNNIYEEYEKSGLNGTITRVNFENSLTTITLNGKLNIIFPNDTDIKYKMSFLTSILKDKLGEDAEGMLDMTKTNPVYSNFKNE